MTKRRDFIKKSIIGTAGIAIGGRGFSSGMYNSIIGANDRIIMGVIGIRNQGSVHINMWCNMKDSHNVTIKTLCDTDEALFPSRLKIVADKTGRIPLTEWDMHKVLDDKDINAVSIVIPNHWHALAAIWACQAGKQVYVEKPASHDIKEGRKMVEAAARYNVLAQVGLNNRSSENVREAIKFIHDGGIGDVYLARGLCYKARDSYGIAADSEPPVTFHYDRWLGPALYRPYNVKRSHYCWHWYWDTGNGDTGNQGPHQFDIARWGLNKNEHPVSVYSAGGIFGFNKDESSPENRTPGTMAYGDVETYGHDKTSQETPNTQSSVFTYKDGKILEFETRGRHTNQEGSRGIEVGNIFYGTEGYLEINGETWSAFRHREKEPFAVSKPAESQDAKHFANFLESVRAGNKEMLHCNINEGFYSATLTHMANISYRLKRHLNFMGEIEKFAGDPDADAMLTREYRVPYAVPEVV